MYLVAFNNQTTPRKTTKRITTNTTTRTNKHRSKTLQPNRIGGLDVGREYSLNRFILDQKQAYFDRAAARNKSRKAYDRDWGDAIVDQRLSDDPGPVNAGGFAPVRRWVVLYRTAETGIDGTHNITVSDTRIALGQVTDTPNPFIIKRLHIWLAPHAVSTHFSGLLITKDDADNGILGGQYSDIAPYGEFVKFRVVFRGEGYVTASSDSGTKQIISIGGSEKWNAVVYAEVESYD